MYFFSLPTKAIELNIVTENIPPFQQLDQNNQVTGFATEIIRAALDKTPYHYSITIYPWSRSYNMAQKKENTCIYSIARTKEREHLFQWVGEIAQRNMFFVGLKSNLKIQINSLADAKNYITAVVRDDVAHQLLIKNEFIEFKNYYVVDNPNSLFKLLNSRKSINLILTDDLSIDYRTKLNGLDPNLFKILFQLNKKPLSYYLACSNNTAPEIIATITKSIALLKQTGEAQNIINKWRYEKKFLSHD